MNLYLVPHEGVSPTPFSPLRTGVVVAIINVYFDARIVLRKLHI